MLTTIKAKRVGQVPDSQREFEYQGFDLNNTNSLTLDDILSVLDNDEHELVRCAAVGYNSEARSKAADPFYGLVPDFSENRTPEQVESLEKTWKQTATNLLKLGHSLEQVKTMMGVATV